jgi:hypothetical protein
MYLHIIWVYVAINTNVLAKVRSLGYSV